MSRPGRRIVTTALLAALCAAFLYQIGLLGMVVWFNFRDPSNTPVMQDTLNTLRAEDPQARLAHEWVPYDRISANLKRAVIASEDSGFVDHDGVEWDAIRKAWRYNQRQADLGRARRRGGSTITQQLAKNLLLSGERTLVRKGQEFVLTLALEQFLTKERILEIYLNNVEWGNGIFGAEAAAQHYFRKSAAQLAPHEAARLAVMLPAPKRFEKMPNSAYLSGRTRTILGRMGSAELP